MVKVIYQGPSEGIQLAIDTEPVARGEEVELDEAQVKALRRYGHRFSEPGAKSDEKNGDKAAKKE